MKIKTEKLKDAALDWAVCEAQGLFLHNPFLREAKAFLRDRDLHPRFWFTRYWQQGGPLKSRNRISTQIKHDGWWLACIYDVNDDMTFIQVSHDELEAAMRCLVASRLGDVVDVPKELLK